MLNWFNQRRNTIAGSALGAFIAGWLLFFCQACLAQTEIDRHVTAADAGIPCHEDSTASHTSTPAADDGHMADHCLGACDCDAVVCDCDAVAASLNSVEQIWTTDKPSSLSPDQAAITVADVSISIPRNLTSTAERQPERAILLPIQRFNVLLI
jgi:hypothetical protein